MPDHQFLSVSASDLVVAIKTNFHYFSDELVFPVQKVSQLANILEA